MSKRTFVFASLVTAAIAAHGSSARAQVSMVDVIAYTGQVGSIYGSDDFERGFYLNSFGLAATAVGNMTWEAGTNIIGSGLTLITNPGVLDQDEVAWLDMFRPDIVVTFNYGPPPIYDSGVTFTSNVYAMSDDTFKALQQSFEDVPSSWYRAYLNVTNGVGPTEEACQSFGCEGQCGIVADNCGSVIDCGPCCEPEGCQPGECGDVVDNCGNVMDCGACDSCTDCESCSFGCDASACMCTWPWS